MNKQIITFHGKHLAVYSNNNVAKQAIIFVHGNSQSAQYWNDVIAQQALHNYACIAIDLPGHGDSFRSSAPDEDYSLKGLAKHTTAFIKQIESKPYIIVANSLGANVVGEMILQLHNCKGVMLTGSSTVGMGLGTADVIMPNANVGICFAETFTDEQLGALIEDCAFNLANDKKELVYITFKNTDPLFRSSLAKCVGEQDYSNELQNMADANIPLAWVYGKEEKLCFTNVIDKLSIPKWKDKTILIENSGHCSQLDQPQKLAKLITEFANDCFA